MSVGSHQFLTTPCFGELLSADSRDFCSETAPAAQSVSLTILSAADSSQMMINWDMTQCQLPGLEESLPCNVIYASDPCVDEANKVWLYRWHSRWVMSPFLFCLFHFPIGSPEKPALSKSNISEYLFQSLNLENTLWNSLLPSKTISRIHPWENAYVLYHITCTEMFITFLFIITPNY